MMKKYFLHIILFLLLPFLCGAQNTIGVLHNSLDAFDGYILYTPVQYSSSYLINNCGQVINQWDSDYSAGLGTQMLPGGKLLRAGRDPNSGFIAAGVGGALQIFDWNGDICWEALVSDDSFGAHHDLDYTTYGSILLLRWEKKSADELIQAGKDPLKTVPETWLPSIVEILPTTNGAFDILWEWHLFDHLVQDLDSSKDNFGIVSEHPRKFDINYANSTLMDWAHLNSIVLNEQRNEIIVSSRNFDEVWIIDHSTTSEEAASDNGGDHDLGGQFLFRYGNDSTYQENPESIIFDGQHDAKFLLDPVTSELIIQVFNNNNESDNKESEIVEIKPKLDILGNYELVDNKFIISGSPRIFKSNASIDFNSGIMSNVQNLPNGNVLINSGRGSYFLELDPDTNLVWEYKGPVSLFGPNEQGSTITGSTFKIQKYDINDTIFDGLDTSIKAEAIELNPNLENCGLVNVNDVNSINAVVYPTIFTGSLTFIVDEVANFKVQCYNINGGIILEKDMTSTSQLNTEEWLPGIYFIRLTVDNSQRTFKVIKSNL